MKQKSICPTFNFSIITTFCSSGHNTSDVLSITYKPWDRLPCCLLVNLLRSRLHPNHAGPVCGDVSNAISVFRPVSNVGATVANAWGIARINPSSGPEFRAARRPTAAGSMGHACSQRRQCPLGTLISAIKFPTPTNLFLQTPQTPSSRI